MVTRERLWHVECNSGQVRSPVVARGRGRRCVVACPRHDRADRKEMVKHMRKSVLTTGAALGVALAAPFAQAHWLVCEKTVEGSTYFEVSSYPMTLHYEFEICNIASEPSTALSAEDPALNYSFEPAAPFTLEVDECISDSLEMDVQSEAHCLELAALDGVADNRLDNGFFVTWDTGGSQCWATIKCMPGPDPDPDPDLPGMATRTPGFYKNHLDALSACLASGPMDLGILTVDSMEAALGLLWGSPAMYDSGGKRSDIDRARFLLARHLMVGVCNERLFGTPTDPPDLLESAVQAITGTDCALMHDLKDDIDAYNNSGTSEDFPEGFEKGPATPQQASGMADDPTEPSMDACG
jgi:hypothetical protein